jgi:predicted enzyme related to lactoylglutathione lyase
MSHNPVGWLEIYVQDMERALVVDTEGNMIGLHSMK